MNKTIISHNANWITILFFTLLFVFIQIFDAINLYLTSFIIKNIFLIVFLYYNINYYRKSNPHNWLLNPAVLASLMTFILSYCITNFIYFIPNSIEENLMYRLLGSDPQTHLNKAMDSVIIAAISMWIGYNSKLGKKLYNLILTFPLNFKYYFRSSFTPNMRSIYILFGIAILARIYAIYLGIFGFAQTPDKLSASIGIAYILLAITNLTTLCLLVISFAHFENPNNYKYKLTFIFILFIEIGFGILSGMKSMVVMPIILAFVIYYLVNNKFHKGFIIWAVFFIVIAYIIIEPFRQIKVMNPNFESTPSNIINTMIDAYSINKRYKIVQGSENIFENILSRNSYLLPAAKSIEYADHPGLTEDDPDFFEKIYTIPIQTFIPRFIWTDKPVEDFGKWYSINLYRSTESTSVAMSPMGFLYFAGGSIMIVLGFFLIGVLQKTLWQFFLAGGGQIIVFLGLLSTVVLIDSAFNGMIVYWLRYVPLFIILQTIVLKKSKSESGKELVV